MKKLNNSRVTTLEKGHSLIKQLEFNAFHAIKKTS